MAGGLLGTAVSGLQVARLNLDTVGHNIANADTDGYSRQRVIAGARQPQITGAGYVGQGVVANNINRLYDEFLDSQLRGSTSAFSELDTFHNWVSQIDNIVADPGTGISPSLQAFFNAVQAVADDPTSIPARQVLLSEGQNLVDRFATMNHRLDDFRSQANQKLTNTVNEINGFSKSIAELNDKIVAATQIAGGKPPNDLLDQRDLLIRRLAEKVNVTTVRQNDGALNVFVGNGQAVVLGTNFATLGVTSSALDPGKIEITFTGQPVPVVITDNLDGGEIGGTLDFLNNILPATQNEIGRVAAGLMLDFNARHQVGYDLTGNTNLDFFTIPLATVLSAAGNSGQVSAVYDAANVSQLAASDYVLERTATGYFLTRTSDQNQTALSPGFPGTPASIDGLIISESVPLAVGDRFLIRPTQNIAGQMGLALTNPDQIAASGSDTSTGSVGDNTNALSLAALKTNRNLVNGTATFQDALGQIVAKVGTVSHAAEVNKIAQEGLLNQATQARESVSGVNLDEEAADLLKYQQAYQAAAQVIAVTGTLFDTLLGVFRN
ncbi:MAG: flagellar hook-associated protein FlgK [Methylococcaceae bacterium]|nr:flagellar hook-associated protein FlgK [Methylococcaceae bacterium]MCI0732859.1 flagellar hook-associated protein FlgK [Methylococcaceae bacterium]